MTQIVIATVLAGGCLSGGGSDGGASVAADRPNSAPSISGAPVPIVTAGVTYEFTPNASDADGDKLTFSVTRLPRWMNFSTSTGRMHGTPSAGDVGVYTDIGISVTDGQASGSIGPFTMEVAAQGSGTASVTLNWSPPTNYEDGSPLTDLAGYRIYWGMQSGNYPFLVTIDNPGISSYVVENLSPGTYTFVATSLNSAGVESRFSNSTSRTIQ